ncbi:MAG: 1-acyl-sn-glycerol-3-phosphate acyltransferase [Spirochaetaceae bacterium]|jgi:1-acyl-sn-glycerol-3-phosphate acyltransferase|nr:1-acyl-sn-glycerol-3-phosphate acyltransferase [Spirochaetaceae bacterium]
MLLLLPAGMLATVFWIFRFRRLSSFCIYKIAQFWARIAMPVTGCEISVRGRENIPRRGSLCIAANHSGIFDILLLLGYTGRPFGFIAKKELALVPLINIWILFLGGLFLDRKNPRKAIKTISQGVRNIQSGGAMLIFPEGTRSKGRGLLPFKAGAFKLAIRAGAPILPVAITGSYEMFEKTKLIVPSKVTIIYGKPVDASEYESAEAKQALADKIHAVIDTLLKTC